MKNVVEIFELNSMRNEDKERILKRGEKELDEIMPKVKEIILGVKERGDSALTDYMEKFNNVRIDKSDFKVTDKEMEEAYSKADPKLVDALKKLKKNVQKFHELQKPKSWMEEISPGLLAGQEVIPLEIVGCYSPGGRGWFPSTMFMNVIPAKVAGVGRIVVCTPPNEDGEINEGALVAADLAGADEIYKLGGAQAIAAMTYGTEIIPKVDKITGPGSKWVVTAKKLVKDSVGIDVEAGPGEGMVLADETAKPEFVASDLIIQAEHGDDSAGVLVTDSGELAEKVQLLVNEYTEELPELRKNFVKTSMSKYGAIILADSMQDGIDFVNEYGVEHLELVTSNPLQTMKRIKNAGGLYLGDYAPLSAGCFCSGPNHVLPTGFAARIRGGLTTEDFLKKVSFEFPSKEGLDYLKNAMVELANYEGFPAHRNAIQRRFGEVYKNGKE